MTETITLLTSDTPPVALTVSRALLVSTSKVFADLLSLPVQDSVDGKNVEIDTHELEEDVRSFLGVLEGKNRSRSEEEWEAVARLADKYDSAVARMGVESRVWSRKLEAKSSPPLEAFALVVYLENPELLDKVSRRVLQDGQWKTKASAVSEEWTKRLPSQLFEVQWKFRNQINYSKASLCSTCNFSVDKAAMSLETHWREAPSFSSFLSK
ncbi:hypothetical protein JCM8097_006161 [Rhodosporidiobolus ruineniae]